MSENNIGDANDIIEKSFDPKTSQFFYTNPHIHQLQLLIIKAIAINVIPKNYTDFTIKTVSGSISSQIVSAMLKNRFEFEMFEVVDGLLYAIHDQHKDIWSFTKQTQKKAMNMINAHAQELGYIHHTLEQYLGNEPESFDSWIALLATTLGCDSLTLSNKILLELGKSSFFINSTNTTHTSPLKSFFDQNFDLLKYDFIITKDGLKLWIYNELLFPDVMLDVLIYPKDHEHFLGAINSLTRGTRRDELESKGHKRTKKSSITWIKPS